MGLTKVSSIVSDQHWAFKKEINVANIIVTMAAILAGFWWLADLETRVILNERGIEDNKQRESILATKLDDIDDKLGILIADFRYYQGVHDNENGK